MATSSTLSQTQRYAAGALLALALRQAQIHQRILLGSHGLDLGPDPETAVLSSDDSDGRDLWTHDSRGLLRPVLRFLEIDPKAWPGVEKTAATSEPKHHIGAFLRKVFEDEDDGEKAAADRSDLELALAKAVDAMAMGLENDVAPGDLLKQHVFGPANNDEEPADDGSPSSPGSGGRSKDYRKMAVLYMLLSACVADVNMGEDGMGSPRIRKGYDARHRVALRLIATWLDVKWIKMEAVEIMVACSAMAAAKEEEKSRQSTSPRSRWQKWRRGGIIGAAALTGGTLMAISGGLAAPAIAAGFTALAPTLHALVPVIGASGFAAIATAAGHTAGSVAVAASFGAAGAGLTGSKMAKRIGDVKEFEFKALGGNHNQGRLAVCIMVSGFAFNDDDFLKPWEGWKTNLERYILQWETKHIIALSTAIQDFLASRVAMELMREGAMQTVLSGIISAFAWPATLVAAADFIDSTWSIAIDRSDKVGTMLAEVLLNGLQGSRPVTLIGFSLGARVVFKCLQELALSGNNEGIVERAVLIGAPVSVKDELWGAARKVVAGRLVNVYSTNDWILGVTFRASLLTQGLAGIQAVHVPGVENVDVSELVVGHSSYLGLMQQILEQLELNTYYPVFSPGTPRSK
ncbi:transmembrane and coiled-coil domain-containing protein 4-like [Hordeum vulgare subsp. vulgare]|uniref:Transmembrane and coiled-coil domain-containing protein 4 n=1 Tax=Hordeum vulgare subsp. vulgare TaxID=112509 RepID=A0A8I6WJ80_HORVV|nr:transmembrane and coiled-coil domain-containing protein 4-like [Hordeum vulgare subsp. vulgare]